MADVGHVGVLSVLYVATARVGLSLDAVQGFAAAVWPPTGVALAALVLYGYRLWPGIALGALLINLAAGAPVLVAGGMALGNTLEALVGAVLLERVVAFRPSLDRLQDALGVIALAAGLSTLVSATIGVTSGWLGGVIPAAMYGTAWYTWWLGDALGALVVAPLGFVWSRRGRVALSRRWIIEAIVLLGAVSVLSLGVCYIPAPALLLPRYLLLAVLILVALRLGPPGAVTALALRSAIAIWGTAQGVGPFAGPTLHDSLLALQTVMSVLAVTLLIVAAAMTERQQAQAKAERRQRETAMLAELAQSLSASLDLDTVLQRVVMGAQELCGSERVFLTLRDSDSETLIGRYEVGAPHRGYAGMRIAPGQGLGGQVLRTGWPWRTADYAADPRFSKTSLAGVRAAGHLAVVAVPLLMSGRVEGVLYASNPTARPFTDQDETILVRLAAHAALAIQNAQLYQQAQAELAERRRAEAALAQAAAVLEQRVAERTAALHQESATRQRLEQAAQRAEHFALLGRLAAGVSHEIRNPLAAVFLHVDVVREELQHPSPDSAPVMAEALTEITQQLARMEDLVEDYLSLVRVANVKRTPQDLGRTVQAWAPEWAAMAAAAGVTLRCDGLETVGVVAVHLSTLRRALLNLVQNALDAMPQGGTLTLRGRRQDTTVTLEVSDTGSGMAPEHQARMFEPLQTTKPGGTGLGLYIVQEVVAAHGGQVAVQSAMGQGSTFTITLPRMASTEVP